MPAPNLNRYGTTLTFAPNQARALALRDDRGDGNLRCSGVEAAGQLLQRRAELRVFGGVVASKARQVGWKVCRAG